jgi:hypothetical protein
VSEELDHSLQQAIETYLNDRLRSIDEQLAHLQTELSDGLARLREQAATQSLDGTTVSAAIFAHLQTARSERLTAVPTPASTRPEAASLKRAVREIEAQRSQADVLKALLRGAVDFADRVALFVVKNDQAIGWRLAKVNDPDLEMIGGVSLPLSAQTIVTRAARDRITTSGADAVDSDYAMLLDQLGGAPAVVTAMPLIVRGKVVAVLYADSSSTDTNAMNVDALDLLTRVAAMAVNLVSIQRAMPAPTETTPAGVPQPEPAGGEPTYRPQVEAPVADEPAEETAQVTAGFDQSIEAAAVDGGEPRVEAEGQGVEAEVSSPPTEAQSSVQESAWTGAADTTRPAFADEPAPTTLTLKPDVVSAQIWPAEAAAPVVEESPQAVPASAADAPTRPLATEPPSQPPTPLYSSDYSTPLGTARRYGVAEPELPVEVSEDERRLHNDARRFARLLVSEIKLYNEPKVQEGRNKGDLYDRLRDDIDRSRQMYDKRVAAPVAARHDYFHQELVNTLAEGDVNKLGMSYPGASVSAA